MYQRYSEFKREVSSSIHFKFSEQKFLLAKVKYGTYFSQNTRLQGWGVPGTCYCDVTKVDQSKSYISRTIYIKQGSCIAYPNQKIYIFEKFLRVVSAIFVLVLFFKSKRNHLSNQEKCFLFHFKRSFRSRENQILEFYIFKFHDVIKCLSIKQEIHFTE